MTATPLILVFIVSADKPKLFNSGGLVVDAQSVGQLFSVSGPPQIPFFPSSYLLFCGGPILGMRTTSIRCYNSLIPRNPFNLLSGLVIIFYSLSIASK